MTHNTDDSPLYIFDGTFDSHRKTKRLMDDYCKPKYFRDDLFKVTNDDPAAPRLDSLLLDVLLPALRAPRCTTRGIRH